MLNVLETIISIGLNVNPAKDSVNTITHSYRIK